MCNIKFNARNESRDWTHRALPTGRRRIDGQTDVNIMLTPFIHLASVKEDVRQACAYEQRNTRISTAICHDRVEHRSQWRQTNAARNENDVTFFVSIGRPGTAERPTHSDRGTWLRFADRATHVADRPHGVTDRVAPCRIS